MRMSKEREKELNGFFTHELNARGDWFDYYNWDSFVECDEILTSDEVDYFRDNFRVRVTLTKK